MVSRWFCMPANCFAASSTNCKRKHPDFLNNQTIEALVDLIIMKAETDQGDKVFDLDDKPILMRQPLTF